MSWPKWTQNPGIADNFKRYMEWRTTVTVKTCICFEQLSHASVCNGIVFIVCDEHAKQFSIPSGPYWGEDCAGLLMR
jgi:hypothetical protein